MFKLKGIKWIFAMVFIVGSATADLYIDGQQIPGTEISSIDINPLSGDITVVTIPGYIITPEVPGIGVAISSFTVSSSNVSVDDLITFTWVTENAVSCEATDGVDGWAGSAISPESGGSLDITAATIGSHTFTVTCTGAEVTDTSSRSVVVNITSPDAVAITSFTASPAEISEGESTTLSWTTSNAASCAPTGGAGGWSGLTLGTSGSETVTISAANAYTFTLTCQGITGDEAVATEVVTVTPPVANCDTPTLTGTVKEWTPFWGTAFPKPVYKLQNLSVPRNGYAAIEFNTGNFVDNGIIKQIENTTTLSFAKFVISQCPGDFRAASGCAKSMRLGSKLLWSTNGTSGCKLDANTTYYLNLTYTDGVNPSSSNCKSKACVATVQHENY